MSFGRRQTSEDIDGSVRAYCIFCVTYLSSHRKRGVNTEACVVFVKEMGHGEKLEKCPPKMKN